MISCSTSVPPSRVESLSWLPPVMKMPVALRKDPVPFGLIGVGAVVDKGDMSGAAPSSRKIALYRSPAVSIDEAVGMMTIRASAMPESAMKVERIARSRNLSSAPPIAMTGPGCPSAPLYRTLFACLHMIST